MPLLSLNDVERFVDVNKQKEVALDQLDGHFEQVVAVASCALLC